MRASVGEHAGCGGLAVGWASHVRRSTKHDPSLELAFRIAAQFDAPIEKILANQHIER